MILPPLPDETLKNIAEKVLKFVWEKTPLKAELQKKLGREPMQLAFKKALGKAYQEFEKQHQTAIAELFDLSFLEKEGIPTLAQFLLPDGMPHSNDLAQAWFRTLYSSARSVNDGSSGSGNNSQEASAISVRPANNRRTRVIELAAADFLKLLEHELRTTTQFDGLNKARNDERLAVAVEAIKQKLEAGKATPGTYWNYLDWLIQRNLYLDPKGTYQTQRQVQLKLDEIYISLKGQPQSNPTLADRLQSHIGQTIQQYFEKADLSKLRNFVNVPSAIDDEDLLTYLNSLTTADGVQLDEIKIRKILADTYSVAFSNTGVNTKISPTLAPTLGQVSGMPVELAQVVKDNRQVIILGDPGGGKSTLLRYLALKHAQTLSVGRTEVGDNLGTAYLPILIRVAEYAESRAWQTMPLSEFLAINCASHECPKEGLADMLETQLSRGHCLVLVDGLDEIVDGHERVKVVEQLENFIRQYTTNPLADAIRASNSSSVSADTEWQPQPASNRFVLTSRIAGYRAAPLGIPLAHYVVQEMDQTQIRKFLERWCQAVEDAQTPDLSIERRRAVAQGEIDGIMAAVQTSPGVARMAANPLLLRTLALIHKTGAQLPRRRIELYKLAADTLVRTWRPSQGVRTIALPIFEEQNLTLLLANLAYWLHLNKPSGLATEREVKEKLGEHWAALKGIGWDSDMPQPDITQDVAKFLVAVREHTGLFVERAPGQYGFLHLTFEEYYAARHLVARRRSVSKLISEHRHDPRWLEPILLALGFVGLDTPQDAADLLESAILGEGEDAKSVTPPLTPSLYEEWLGRDFFLALRCVGDDIPLTPQRHRQILERLTTEIMEANKETTPGSVRRPVQFKKYQQELLEMLVYLKGTALGQQLCTNLTQALDQLTAGWNYQEWYLPLEALKALGYFEPAQLVRLLRTLADPISSVNWRTAICYVWNEGGLYEKEVLESGLLTEEKLEALLVQAINDPHEEVRLQAVMCFEANFSLSEAIEQALEARLSDSNLEISLEAAKILWNITALDETNPLLLEVLINHFDELRMDDNDNELQQTILRHLLGFNEWQEALENRTSEEADIVSLLNPKKALSATRLGQVVGLLNDSNLHYSLEAIVQVMGELSNTFYDTTPLIEPLYSRLLKLTPQDDWSSPYIIQALGRIVEVASPEVFKAIFEQIQQILKLNKGTSADYLHQNIIQLLGHLLVMGERQYYTLAGKGVRRRVGGQKEYNFEVTPKIRPAVLELLKGVIYSLWKIDLDANTGQPVPLNVYNSAELEAKLELGSTAIQVLALRQGLIADIDQLLDEMLASQIFPLRFLTAHALQEIAIYVNTNKVSRPLNQKAFEVLIEAISPASHPLIRTPAITALGNLNRGVNQPNHPDTYPRSLLMKLCEDLKTWLKAERDETALTQIIGTIFSPNSPLNTEPYKDDKANTELKELAYEKIEKKLLISSMENIRRFGVNNLLRDASTTASSNSSFTIYRIELLSKFLIEDNNDEVREAAIKVLVRVARQNDSFRGRIIENLADVVER